MRLDRLVAGIGPVDGPGGDVEVSGLAYDSRSVRPGALFFCVPGFRSDGHDFAAQAVADGAVALVVERPLGLGVPEVLVPSVRAAMGPVASRFHGDPSAALRVVGITGTNGKTTTAFLVRALLQAAGEQTGLVGTVTSIVGGEERQVQRTTPEAIDLHAGFRAMLEGGDRACAMEVSSHALSLGRAGGIRFAAAVFTNLTQDHLDFHPSMEDYFLAKRLLFLPGEGPPPGVSVVNVGDPYGRRLAAEIGAGALTFAVGDPGVPGVDGPDAGRDVDDADYRAMDLRCDFEGCRFALRTPIGTREVMLPMPGRFNVANALGALTAVHALGFDLDTLIVALQRGVRVPGRFEPVDAGQDFAVLVDYAHTPDSLDNVLRSARDIAQGRVISVFGAGGDRDRAKRPLMGEISARLADITLVTSDNPRSEAPAAIVAEIVSGIPSTAVSEGSVHIEVDRRAAIDQALSLALTDDVVVIAGKGHEQGQELADGRKEPFDDVTVTRELLAARAGAPAGAGE
ncbi:MAG TPA: UDP-N-acetylmuramoyl-L-alanyl-D-glutamate--2,6-diaminopimelate ligase [Solirubrobacteraceae bacterium]|jgi:UDP-N-acetylmuramoyl-L-alanyl-D-glutamate--2,6-diaminopimelate ligase|nr:UDP-N-acetylmuramoyl-L-alanyl-D-glutamate--2,6-diaminopimelate ligase [Solirubrobacteraceae bacterium]